MKQAIALAGGGTKGAYQVGAWKAMRELGIPFDIVTGTSIGSVTAALMVQGDFDRAWELWTHITEEQIMLERADATPHEKRELAALAEHPEQLIARVKDWADLNRRTADITPYCALVHQYLDEALFRLAGGFRTHDGAFPVVPAGRGAQAGHCTRLPAAVDPRVVGVLPDVSDVRDRRAELPRRRVLGQSADRHGVSPRR